MGVAAGSGREVGYQLIFGYGLNNMQDKPAENLINRSMR